MPKKLLKKKIAALQGGACALSGDALEVEPSLVDTDRIVERFNGGTYTEENTRIVTPLRYTDLVHSSSIVR